MIFKFSMKKEGFGCVKKHSKNGQSAFWSCEKKAINGQNVLWSCEKLRLNGQKPFRSFGTKVAAGALHGRKAGIFNAQLVLFKELFCRRIFQKKNMAAVFKFLLA